MRLQLVIHRHTLPTCHILFSTGFGPASHTGSRSSTISDLLADVNALVPLESDDGEWGLEDYVVEVAATLEQELRYECLHFCEIRKILREDDEVVIRGLSQDELRERRKGKRFQISTDGRHLVDGIGWGKKWVRAEMNRPGVTIPARKKRRLLADLGDDEKDNDLWDFPPQLKMENQDELEDDDQDDGEYQDNAAEDGVQLQILARQDFEDADEDNEDSAEDENRPAIDEDDESVIDDDIDAEELAGLLDDVQNELMDADADLARVDKVDAVSLPSIKRKRETADDGEDQDDDSEFEGFQSPFAVRGVALADLEEDAGFDKFNTAYLSSSDSASDDEDSNPGSDLDANVEGEPHRPVQVGTATTLPDYDGSSDARGDLSDDDGEEGLEIERIVLGDIAEVEREDTSSSSEDSSENESDEDSDDSEDRIGEHNNNTPDLPASLGEFAGFDDAPITSSSEDSSSEDETDSDDVSTVSVSDKVDDSSSSSSDSSSDSESDSEDEVQPGSAPVLPKPMTAAAPKTTQSAPGNGLLSTRTRNDRIKKRTRLNALKAEGLLPPDAGFSAMYTYDQQQEEVRDRISLEVPETLPDDKPQVEVDEKRRELLALLEAKNDPVEVDNSTGDFASAPIINGVAADENQKGSLMDGIIENNKLGPSMDETGHDSNSNKEIQAIATLPKVATPIKDEPMDGMETKSEPAKPRSRLDLASSRRLLFASLGLRNPKTLAAEQALREKLSQSIRKNPFKTAGDDPKKVEPNGEYANTISSRDSSWKTKLVLSAKECVQEDMVLAKPSFPFEQNLVKATRRLDKKKARNREQYYHGEDEDYDYAPDVSMLDESRACGETSFAQSKTLSAESAESEDLPRPASFANLAVARPENTLPGAIIGFKEWQINASGEPGISDYRVARVLDVDDRDGSVSLKISKRDRDIAQRSRYDEVTGERLFSRFEAAAHDDEDDEHDDIGERTLQFTDLQEVKIIEPSTLQVAASSEDAIRNRSGLEPSPLKEDQVLVPDSEPQQFQAVVVEEGPNFEDVVEISEVSVTRRDEIRTMIKDAGFDSALDSQLLQPIAITEDNDNSLREESQDLGTSQLDMANDNATVNTTSFESPHYNGWSSSPPKHTADDDAVAEQEQSREWPSTLLSENNTPKAPSFIVEVQSVRYPRISQLDLAEDSILGNGNGGSSSHQDAQRQGNVVDANVSLGPSIAHDTTTELDNGHDESALNDSLTSVVPQSENDVASDIQSSLRGGHGGVAEESESFLGPGLDGHVSFGSEADSEYVEKSHRTYRNRSCVSSRSHSSGVSNDDSNSDKDLLDIGELTSSQAIRTRAASRSGRVSPPALKKKSGMKLRSSSGSVNVNGRPRGMVKREKSGSPDLLHPRSSSRETKVSASQSQGLRMSPIPQGTQVVDLTMSSDPPAAESESDYGGYGRQNGRGLGPGVNVGLGRKKLLVLKKAGGKSRV